VAYVLALLAALANALSSIFQRIGVQNAPDDTVMSVRLIRHAFSNAIWFLGLAMIAAGFLLQAGALHFGQLSSVQPLVTSELLFLVLILGVWFRYHLTWREWGGSLAAAGGLATFLVVGDPGGGSVIPGRHAWIAVFVIIGAVSAGCAALGFTGPRWFRAAMFGSAGAVLFALSAALTKQLTTLVSEGWGHVFTDWVPYALVVTGVTGLFLIQSSFQTGPITASQAAITIIDPIVSVVIGIYLFHDHIDTVGWRLPVEVVGILVVVAGVMVLCTSPLVAGAKDESGKGDKLVRQVRHHRSPRVDPEGPTATGGSR
jgi:drug/metabolite transporter (DMT)-like permease